MTDEQRRTHLITMVTSRIDEYTENIIGEAPEAPIGDIEEELDHSAHAVLRAAPRGTVFLAAKRVDDISASSPSKGFSTIIPLPEDFLRFVSVKLTGWKRPANSYVSDDSKVYQRQIYPTRRGTDEKPIAAMIDYDFIGQEEKRAIEAFPKGSFEYLSYVPCLAAEKLPKELDDALIWHTASVVLNIMRQHELSQATFGRYTNALVELSGGVADGQGE